MFKYVKETALIELNSHQLNTYRVSLYVCTCLNVCQINSGYVLENDTASETERNCCDLFYI